MRMPSTGLGFDWGGFATNVTTIVGGIATKRWGNPDVAPGTLIRGADGSMISRQEPGYPVFGGSVGANVEAGGSLGVALTVGVIGLVAVFVLSQRR